MGEPKGPELADTLAASTPPASAAAPELAATQADAPVPMELARGDAIGRYLVLERIGAGGMGVVYRAYDPSLDRAIALKLVRHRAQAGTSSETDGRGRMLREAQAIARLSHPNVVAIHDVGTDGDVVFIAMELVDGDTLAGWLRDATRTIPQILDVFAQAGRGLAAAHRSGLVHRDFKPDNVLVGRDGRTRVVDFGLVRGIEGSVADDAIVEPHISIRREPRLSTPMTQMGALMGTPLYMSPEQLLQRTTDARTDQYSFCVSLYEALVGELPYKADDLPELKSKVLAGKLPAIPAARRVPAHVAAAIRRGASVDAAARFATMDELVAELLRDPAATRRRWLVGGAVVAAIGIAAAVPLIASRRAETAQADPCGGGGAQIANAWNPEKKAGLRAAFAATGARYADAELDAVSRRLDAYASGWRTSYTESCAATNVRHEQSVELLDLRTACLASHRTELAALVELLAQTDAKSLERAHLAAAALSPVAECDDLTALQAPVRPPSDPKIRAAIASVRDDLARASAMFYSGHFAGALVAVNALAPRAAATGFEPVVAEVDYNIGQIRHRGGDVDGASVAFFDALVAATASKHDELAFKIAAQLVENAADKQEFVRGHDWVALSRGLTVRLGNTPELQAILHHVVGYLLSAEGKYADAAKENEAALAIREKLPDSAALGRTLDGLAFTYDELGRYKEARAAGERALALQQADLGPMHPDIGMVLNNLGNIASDEGDTPKALEYYQRALAIRETDPGDDPLLLANVLNNLGVIAHDDGRYDDALGFHERALDIRQKVDALGPDVSMSLVNIGSAQCKKGDHATALATYKQALDVAEGRLGKVHPYVGDALVGIGECSYHLHHLEDARAALERALAIRDKGGGRPEELADVQLDLARTLWDLGQKARAKELATAARAGYAGAPAMKARLADTDAWLASHVN